MNKVKSAALSIALLVTALLAPASVVAEGLLPGPPDDRPTAAVYDLQSWLDEARPVSLEPIEPRLELGPLGLGLHVAPRRPNLDLAADGVVPGSAPVRYRLTDADPRTTDIGLDLEIRWPSAFDPTGGALKPYVSVGPAVSVAQVEPSPFASPATRAADHAGLGGVRSSIGMRGAIGLTWHVSHGASLFGEYRLTQERPIGGHTGSELGADFLYGLNIRF